MATTSRSSNPAAASRTERDRLRDYYGLAGDSSNATASSSSTSAGAGILSPPPSSPSLTSRHHTSSATPTTLPSLLSHHTSLLTSMRELDGERQSLVYNHHGDLVAASQTMERLRDHQSGSGGGGLEESLGALKRSTEALGKWEGQLGRMLEGVTMGRSGGDGDGVGQRLNVAKEVMPIVTLPQRLRDVAALRGAEGNGLEDEGQADSIKSLEQGLAAAEALWGRHESILSSWSSQGVQGAAAVADECRAVLREQRERVAEVRAGQEAIAAVGSSPMARRREQAQLEQGTVGGRR